MLIFTLDFLCLWPTKSGMDALENMIHSQKLIFPRASVFPAEQAVNSYTLTMLILFYFWFRVLKKSSLPRASSSTVCQAGLRLFD